MTRSEKPDLVALAFRAWATPCRESDNSDRNVYESATALYLKSHAAQAGGVVGRERGEKYEVGTVEPCGAAPGSTFGTMPGAGPCCEPCGRTEPPAGVTPLVWPLFGLSPTFGLGGKQK